MAGPTKQNLKAKVIIGDNQFNSNTMIKKLITFYKYLLIIQLFSGIVACDQDNNVTPTSNDAESVSEFLMNDSGLIITLLTDDEDIETYYFDSYVFTFKADGTVVAANTGTTVNGTYSVFRDDGRTELRMNFPNIQNFDELNDDWYLVSIVQNTIRFIDDGDILEFRQQ